MTKSSFPHDTLYIGKLRENGDMHVDFLNLRYLGNSYDDEFTCIYTEEGMFIILSRRSNGFFTCLTEYVKRCGISAVECYKKANVSRQTWNKIVSLPYYCPSKRTIAAFAIALRLDLDDTQKLMKEGGYFLSESIIFDLAIRYCIENGVYDTTKVDAILCGYGEKALFSVE